MRRRLSLLVASRPPADAERQAAPVASVAAAVRRSSSKMTGHAVQFAADNESPAVRSGLPPLAPGVIPAEST